MNKRVADIIALELAILIAILAWMAFARATAVKPSTRAEMLSQPADSFTSVAPLFKSRNQLPAPAHSDAEIDEAPPASPQVPAATAQVYVQEITTEPYADAGLQNDLLAGGASSYDEFAPEPLLASPDYFVPPVTQFIEYVQPTTFVIISRNRPFIHRRDPMPHCGGTRVMVAPRKPLRNDPPRGRVPSQIIPPSPPVGGIVSHRKPTARPTQPKQGINVGLNR